MGELQHLLIQSTTQLVVVLDHLGGKPIGLVTLHDLLRAEETLAESAASETEASL